MAHRCTNVRLSVNTRQHTASAGGTTIRYKDSLVCEEKNQSTVISAIDSTIGSTIDTNKYIIEMIEFYR